MRDSSSWDLLQISPTSDTATIRKAYARRLRDFRPDEDPAGFQRLVEARKQAMAYANGPKHPPDTADAVADISVGSVPEIEMLTAPIGDAVSDQLPDGDLDTQHADKHYNSSPLFYELDALIAEARQRMNNENGNASRRLPWDRLFSMAANQLSYREREEFIKTLARGIAGLFPEERLSPFTSYEDHHGGIGIAAVADSIETEALFSEDPGFLYDLAGAKSAQIYFSWLQRASQANAVRSRLENGKSSYFRNDLPVFPPNDRPRNTDALELGSFYDSLQDVARWPASFKISHMFLSSVGLMRTVNPWLGAIILILGALATVQTYLAETSTGIWLAIGIATVLIGFRVSLGFFAQRIALRKAVERVMRADQRHLLNPWVRDSFLVAPFSARWNGIQRFAGFFEISVFAFVCLALLGEYGSMQSQKIHKNDRAEDMIIESMSVVLNAQQSGYGYDQGDFLNFLKRIKSSQKDGFVARLLEHDTRVGELSNQLWLPRLFDARDQVLNKDNRSPDALFERRLLEMLRPPGADLYRSGKDHRVEKLRTLAFLYRIGTPAMRISIENVLLNWIPIADTISIADLTTLKLAWNLVPPQDLKEFSKGDGDLVRKFRVWQLNRMVQADTGSNSLFEMPYLLLETIIGSPGRFFEGEPLYVFKPSFIDLPEPMLPTFPARGIGLYDMINGWRPTWGNTDSKARTANRIDSIFQTTLVTAGEAQKIYFEIVDRQAREPSADWNSIAQSIVDVPPHLYPSDPSFWATATVNLQRAQPTKDLFRYLDLRRRPAELDAYITSLLLWTRSRACPLNAGSC